MDRMDKEMKDRLLVYTFTMNNEHRDWVHERNELRELLAAVTKQIKHHKSMTWIYEQIADDLRNDIKERN